MAATTFFITLNGAPPLTFLTPSPPFSKVITNMIYFGCPLDDQDKSWAQYEIYKNSCLGLHNWLNKRSSMLFAVSMIWREPKDNC